MKQILLSLSIALLLVSCTVNTRVYDLQTEYMTNPLGIEVLKPRFSWKTVSKEDNWKQAEYQLMVATSEENLRMGILEYNSGRVKSDNSVGVEYAGEPVKPCQRYWWKVVVWDAEGKETGSKENAWFETGLMDSGWSEAQWIGSKNAYFSKYRSQYNIEFNLDPSGTDPVEFVWGLQDADNFAACTFKTMEGKKYITFSYVRDGVRKTYEGCSSEITKVLSHTKKGEKAHVVLYVTTGQTPQYYSVKVKIGKKMLTSKNGKEQQFSFSPYQQGELIHKCRLWNLGNIPEAISDVKIYDNAWDVLIYDGNEEQHHSAPMLRKHFDITKKVASARVYATSRGINTLMVNGKQVGDDYFNPGWTDYRFRLMYNTYDITDMLKAGSNVVGATLGSGWWADHCGFFAGWQNQYGIYLQLLYKMVIKYTDGTSQVIVSDGSWLCNDRGPVLENGFMNGEDYDAGREPLVENLESKVEDGWYPARVYDGSETPQTKDNKPVIEAYIGNPVRCEEILTAVSVNEPLPGVFVYDMGQNMVGVPKVSLKGAKGQKITFKYGEMAYPQQLPVDPVAPYTIEMYKEKQGQVYTDNYRSALSTDHYICSGEKEGEVFSPKFTFHGFRYIQIEGLSEALPLENVQGLVLNSIGEQKSSFKTSDENINRLFENIVWGERGNFLSIPTDCPQRDERMGWMGDAQIFARTAGYNMDVDQFYTRWMRTLRDNQGSDGNYVDYAPVVGIAPYGANTGNGAMGWTDAGVIVPWSVYLQFGDKRILEEHYESMVRFMGYLQGRAKNCIQPKGGYGDWLAIESSPTLLTNTAYSAYDAQLMAKIATILGKEEDAARFSKMYDDIKAAFNKYFVDEEGYTVSPTSKEIFGYDVQEWFPTGVPKVRNSKRVHTQTSYVVPMRFGLFNDDILPKAVKRLEETIADNGNCLSTGFIGTPYLNLVLSAEGNDALAYTLFEQTEYPSWLYPVLQGATTIWERWNSYTLDRGFGPVDMNSFNHYSYGAIQEWMFSYMLGIEVDENAPGYKHIILRPRAGGSFSFAEGGFETPYGRVESRWEKTPEGKFKYTFAIPANTTATLYLPDGSVTEKGSGKFTVEL